ncbi:hypothetical protein C8F01DRAFT_1134663 [Mycena amicta]|nr:hypothetical protein C8F01DRAFT_1134663 [Mycena amicta]
MHRCLQIPEIAWQVAGHVPESHRKTLLALALTCRLFQDPALDQLWRDPGADTLQYLIACFPPGLVTTSLVAGKLVVKLLRSLTLSDWDRPRQYCARVRKYRFAYLACITYTDALSLMSIWLPWPCLLPRLEFLECDITLAEEPTIAAQHIKLFFSPTLRNIRLFGQPALILSSLPLIIVRDMPLTHLEIGNGVGRSEWTAGDCTAISALARRLSRLQSLNVPGIDGDTLQHLATLVGLSSLELNALPPDLLLRMHDTGTAFLTLKEFSISEAHLPSVIRFLPLLANSPLQELTITPNRDATTAQITQLYAAVATTISTSSLRSISLDPFEDGDSTWGVSRDVFSCLRSFPALTSIFLRSCGGLDVDDSTVVMLVRACPLLEALCLAPHNSTTLLTLAVLIPIARHCPALCNLGLTLNTSTIPPSHPPSPTEERVVQDCLTEIDMGYSRIVKEFPVARFLSGLFPSLGELYTSWEPDDTAESTKMDLRWKRVAKLLPQLREIREEEQLWAEHKILFAAARSSASDSSDE